MDASRPNEGEADERVSVHEVVVVERAGVVEGGDMNGWTWE